MQSGFCSVGAGLGFQMRVKPKEEELIQTQLDHPLRICAGQNKTEGPGKPMFEA